MNPTYGSVCSGIEAASVAWEPLGWKPLWFAEIEPFPSAVLAHHWPHVPNLGDFTRIKDGIASGTIEAPDVLVGGTPCQAFSFAGLRESMDDARGQLTLEFVRLADAIDEARSVRGRDPGIAVWENVPGVLSTHDNAFGCFLGAMAGEDGPLEPPGGRWTNAGHVRGPKRTIVWRTLDAQYFGVAQRRRRVFVVASARTDCGPEILFEFDGVRRDSPPRRQQGQGASSDAQGGTGTGSHWDWVSPHPSLTQSHNTGGIGQSNQEIFSQGGSGLVPSVARTLSARHDGSHCPDRGMDVVAIQDVAGTLRSGSTSPNAHGKLNGTDRMDLVVHTLAIRGCGDHRVLETRNDGTANALLLPNGGRDGIGVGAVAFDCKASGSYGFQESPDTAGTLRGAGHGGGHSAIGIPATSPALGARDFKGQPEDVAEPALIPSFFPPRKADTLYIEGITQKGEDNGGTQKGNSGAILCALRDEIGAEAFAKWGLGVLDTLQGSEVLRQSLHGEGVRLSAQIHRWLVGVPRTCEEPCPPRALFQVWESQCPGRTSRRWESSEQLRGQLGAYLQELSQSRAQATRFMHDLWDASEGVGVLREALSALQEVGRPHDCQGQPTHTMQVRRLTPDECAILQGFPDHHARIPWRKHPAEDCPDGPQYKAYGNSMCTKVMRWIGNRLDPILRNPQ